jgi:hypothetical protein
MDEEMEKDPKVMLMGEEVAAYHGAYKVGSSLSHAAVAIVHAIVPLSASVSGQVW